MSDTPWIVANGDGSFTFRQGHIAECNHCGVGSPLPKDCQGHVDNARTSMRAFATRTVYRLDTMCTLPNCGHMDSHWVIVDGKPHWIIEIKGDQNS